MFPATLTIDGADIDVRIKRMTNTEFDAFAEGLDLGTPRGGAEETAAERKAREAESAAWMREALNAYFFIVAGEMEHEGREITKGGDLMDIYGGRLDVVPTALALVTLENRLSETQKKTSRLALASRLGSPTAPLPTGSGDGLGPTVVDAVPPASAPPVHATGSASDASSGTTEVSC